MSSTLRRTCVWLLLAALVLAQSLALLHRVVHGARLGGLPVAQAARADAAPASRAERATPTARASLAALFTDHADDASCRLLDQLAHDAPLVAAIVMLPLALPVFIAHAAPGGTFARWTTPFEARGPPACR